MKQWDLYKKRLQDLREMVSEKEESLRELKETEWKRKKGGDVGTCAKKTAKPGDDGPSESPLSHQRALSTSNFFWGRSLVGKVNGTEREIVSRRPSTARA